MIIATIPLPKLEIPEDVRQFSHEANVGTRYFDVPLGAACWVASPEVWPHVDESFAGSLFLTLSVVGDRQHDVADEKVEFLHEHRVYPGALFVVDPMVRHWLAPSDHHSLTRHPWIGLQWEVPRRSAKKRARAIVKQLGGTWVDCRDKRYAGWREIAGAEVRR